MENFIGQNYAFFTKKRRILRFLQVRLTLSSIKNKFNTILNVNKILKNKTNGKIAIEEEWNIG